MSLALIGYRGTGKTTVARYLAGQLGWPAYDADEELERRAGQSIAEIFATAGEGAFRDLESAVLLDLVQQPRAVLSLGGGVILREENRKALGGVETVVWLEASPATISERIAGDQSTTARRPNLTARGGLAEITELLEARAVHYRQCSAFSVSTEGRSPAEIGDEILARQAALWKSEG